MIPLYLQLENRYRDLEDIREFLWNLEGEVLTDQMIEHLSIDFHHLDIDTGATSDLVTPYFLPRASFPTCRDMTGDLDDEMLAEEDRHHLFPAALLLTHDNYACEMRGDLERRFRLSE